MLFSLFRANIVLIYSRFHRIVFFSTSSRVRFTAKIEVTKCPKDPRQWKQTFQIYPVGINEALIVNLEMLCQCDCEKPGHPVRK